VKTVTTPALSDLMRQLHPLRLSYEFFSDANPTMSLVRTLADEVRKDRKPAATGNVFTAVQENVSQKIVAALDAWRDGMEACAERIFMTVYGSTPLQVAAHIDPDAINRPRSAPRSLLHRELLQKRIEELRARISAGGLREASIRALLYAGMGRNAVDERGFGMLRRIRDAHSDISLPEFKALVREQFLILLLDTKGALSAIPTMLPADIESRRKAFNFINQVMNARGDLSTEDEERLHRIAQLFGEDSSASGRNLSIVPAAAESAMAS